MRFALEPLSKRRDSIEMIQVRSAAARSMRPNHSFNREQWGMPPFGAPFHSAPNVVIPHCSG